MTPAPGLRRFVRPDRPDDPAGPGRQAGPGDPATPDSPGHEHEHGHGQTSAQSAAGSLPPLVAQLLADAPREPAGPPESAGLPEPPGPPEPAGAPDAASLPEPAGPPGTADLPAAGRSPGARTGGPAPETEKCELCSAGIPAEHGHVADLENASLVCACRACYLLFTQPAAGRGRYRAVPDRYLSDPGPPLAAAEWDRLEIPVGLAFFLRSSAADRVAGFYPSPAGVTECVLDLGAWEELTRDHPLLGAPDPDVEAALICRTDDGIESFVVPIDACYELAGRMRLHWRGFDGGAEARASIAGFLDTVRSQARPFTMESQSG